MRFFVPEGRVVENHSLGEVSCGQVVERMLYFRLKRRYS